MERGRIRTEGRIILRRVAKARLPLMLTVVKERARAKERKAKAKERKAKARGSTTKVKNLTANGAACYTRIDFASMWGMGGSALTGGTASSPTISNISIKTGNLSPREEDSRRNRNLVARSPQEEAVVEEGPEDEA